MLRGFLGNLIFAITARMLCGNHLKYSFLMLEVICFVFPPSLGTKLDFLFCVFCLGMAPSYSV